MSEETNCLDVSVLEPNCVKHARHCILLLPSKIGQPNKSEIVLSEAIHKAIIGKYTVHSEACRKQLRQLKGKDHFQQCKHFLLHNVYPPRVSANYKQAGAQICQILMTKSTNTADEISKYKSNDGCGLLALLISPAWDSIFDVCPSDSQYNKLRDLRNSWLSTNEPAAIGKHIHNVIYWSLQHRLSQTNST